MKIDKILIKNYKLFKDQVIKVNVGYNIFVGNNDSGKSTLLEILQIVISGKMNNYPFERQLKASYFNYQVRQNFILQLQNPESTIEELPSIVLEVYFKDVGSNSEYKGRNNYLGEDCPGINMSVKFNPIYSKAFVDMLKAGEIYDIPVEFYDVTWNDFSGNPIIFRTLPFKVSVMDTTKKDYSNSINKFISSNIAENLTSEEQVSLARTYRKIKHEFNSNESVASLNNRIRNSVRLDDKEIRLSMREEVLDAWKNEVSVDVEHTPFEDIGFGSQNLIKMELVMKENSQKSNFILFEEPENNLSFSNMSKLISRISSDDSKQVFISTHSSFVANKIGLKNIILLHQGQVRLLNDVNAETMDFFVKLPGYNTLRFLLAKKIILVEGPTDELIVQRAYFDKYGKLPIEDATDVITVDSLAFKRYCDLALLIKKPLNIITDNDNDIDKNIIEKYKDYIGNNDGLIKAYYEENEDLHTLEPSILAMNLSDSETFSRFKNALSKNGSMQNKSENEILSFMLSNKVEWGLRVFNSKECIKYPEYIEKAIKK
ncbi:ATP-dependent nuclease [Planococcus lenghuensis]|uniref:Uncharacterized protein n=1 Tax=Planococcus lenghuensis TaxID=2213202 RepID=A0A1Q2L506_9BACL|nr:AAA family ATPase [Planococcus lenghuensis]AQQ55530.1 hypothetical protein B0X71_20355 [Planococcus lenghuensis]